MIPKQLENNMSDIRLSICMPTYNFGKYIRETLNSIAPQLTSKTELIIVDGASTDNTSEIVHEFQKKYPQIHYHRLNKKGGIDKDLALSVSLASGDYCWLFSSDDLMNKTAIFDICQEFAFDLDVYLLGCDTYSLNMEEFFEKDLMLNCQGNAFFNLSEKKERLAYFKKAVNSEAFFSFMSSVVVKKSRWDETEAEEFMGTCFAHAARIFRMIPKGLCIKYLHHSYLRKRSGNDSFLDKGLVHRLAITIDGYQKISDTVFGHDSEEAAHIRRVIQKEISPRSFLKAKILATTQEESQRIIPLAQRHFCDKKLLSFVATKTVALFPLFMGKFVLFIYKKRRRMKKILKKALEKITPPAIFRKLRRIFFRLIFSKYQ
jgi:abequosyltransferase